MYLFTVHGSRFTVHGSRFTVHGSRFTVHGSRFTVHGSRFTVHGSRPTLHYARRNPSHPPFFKGRSQARVRALLGDNAPISDCKKLVGFLQTDVNASHRINASDIASMKARINNPSTQITQGVNFKYDVDLSG